MVAIDASSWIVDKGMIVQNLEDRGDVRNGSKSASVSGIRIGEGSLVLCGDGSRVIEGEYFVLKGGSMEDDDDKNGSLVLFNGDEADEAMDVSSSIRIT